MAPRLRVVLALLSVAAAGAAGAAAAGGADGYPYSVPEAEVRVRGRAFSVGVPGGAGVSLFAFHGNLNRPIGELEAGEFSADVTRPDAADGRWTFRARARAPLRPGDRLHYWLYVIRDGVGHRSEVRQFLVTPDTEGSDAVPSQAPTAATQPTAATHPVPSQPVSAHPVPSQPMSAHPVPSQPTGDHRRQPPPWAIAAGAARPSAGGSTPPGRQPPSWAGAEAAQPSAGAAPTAQRRAEECGAAVAQAAGALAEAGRLRAENRLLRELLEGEGPGARWRGLRLEGRLPGGDALRTVREVLREKLRLPGVRVAEASREADGAVAFSVGGLQDRLDIAEAAARAPPHSGIRILPQQADAMK